MTPSEAYDSILQFSPVSDRSEEAARSAVECAQKLIAGAETKSFGWSRRQKRERLLDEQVAILRQYAAAYIIPGVQIASQGEHHVWHEDGSDHVIKLTNQDRFGFVVDQENDNRGNKLALRHAIPSEYLLRLGTQNVAFGDVITLQGIQAGRVPSIVTAQPEVDHGRPTQEDIHAFFSQCGFIRLPDEMMMQQYSSKPFWYRPSDSIITADANPENFSRVTDDIIVPIDLITHPMDVSLIHSTATQNGVNLDKYISSYPVG
ncbi:MAG: hypothetical protein V4662_16600 [Verrucomicrobiota bacterium]